MLITRRLEFDAGHRISTHNSQCRHLHGHRYVIEISLSGNIISDEGVPEQGMVLDFSAIKRIAKEVIVDKWDHAFLVYAGDKPVVDFLQSIEGHKTVIFDSQPTAENLAVKAFQLLDRAFEAAYGNRLRLEQVRLYETPNCWADAKREKIDLTNHS
ncbi:MULTISPECIES: 6-carboxytetrahydropterin synthase QueD [Nitrosomonas]|uniref:6-carboxy-5,6,7,8-tetrahydropterin synthase n=1 Tax=Nitrosomonas nitrosa TaxID=52442 RepID=A0A8H9D7I6_9PROT|nr:MULTISPECIES: 6-carboxytetrahydropterin synthase QueD [Nitrosomonas]MCW5598032.1 6-carboxytetrahydropterin synthase QueD [Nitrosomonas sp.]MCW5600268.1 6-carboxytetrahydropterin synthase QueD [Nitrosomonas sp.]CAE6484600.1 6-carboxy-5,6,7,8-tetrahydropterin synthase [Nitrosomonas nitrosa]